MCFQQATVKRDKKAIVCRMSIACAIESRCSEDCAPCKEIQLLPYNAVVSGTESDFRVSVGIPKDLVNTAQLQSSCDNYLCKYGDKNENTCI